MAELGGLAFLGLLLTAIGGPIAVFLIGFRAAKWALMALFVLGTVGIPMAAASEPVDFRGTAVIMAVMIFVFGLIAISVAGASMAPRRGR